MLPYFGDMTIDEIEKEIRRMSPGEREQMIEIIRQDLALWRPLPGPQSDAYYSEADVIGYGGAAGGGKTDLICGMALTKHPRTVVVRADGQQLFGVRERLGEIDLTGRGWNGQDRVWRHDNGVIELRGIPNKGDEKKLQGRAHGLKAFDEATELLEAQVRFIMSWMRTEVEGQKPQALMTFNPPTTVEGRWVIRYFGPWLDKKHRNRAQPGELRLFTTIAGEDFETEDDRKFVIYGGERIYDFDPEDFTPEEIIKPKSRTFIPSRVTDNPYYMRSDYIAQLQASPEPLRSQMLYGDFEAGMEDDRWQVIPTAWVEAAMDRWKPRDAKGQMDSMGVDPAMGGLDKFVIARRHGTWFDDLLRFPGRDVPDGPTGAGLVLMHRRDAAPVHVDIVGWGASCYDFLVQNHVQAVKINGANGSMETSLEGNLRFVNYRAQLIWRMREALSPTAKIPIYLPDDGDLLQDLCAYRWKMTTAGILIKSKEEMRADLGRSPDDGDAVIYALVSTVRQETILDQIEGAYAMHDDAGGWDRASELGL